RSHEGDVYDQLIDDVLPDLRAPALAKLLAWTTNDHLHSDTGDGMIDLFVPAFDRAAADDASREVLLARLSKYITDCMDYSRGGEIVDGTWQILDAEIGRAHV